MIELIQSGIFSVFFIVISTIIGYSLTNFVKTEQKNFFFHFIIGYFSLVAIQWFIVVPSNILHLSWQFYKSLYLVTILILIIACCFYIIKNSEEFVIYIKALLKNKNFYFVISVAILFAGFSILYTIPFFNANHQDDGFYLARVVQEIGTNKMGVIDSVIGVNLPGFDLIRSINTYEVFYGLLAEISQINPVIMARVTFTMINAFAVISGIQYVFSKFDRKHGYVYVVAFSFFLLPESILNTLELNLTDAWRLNTAIWYGSSIAKFVLPAILVGILIEFSKKEKNKITDIAIELLLFGIVAVASIAFASQSIVMLILALLGYGFVLAARTLTRKKSVHITRVGYITFTVLLSILLFGKINDLFAGNVSEFVTIFIQSPITMIVIILTVFFILKRRHIQLGVILLFTVIFTIIPILNTLFLVSGQFIFVFQRFYESIAYLLITYVIAEMIIFIIRNSKIKLIVSIALIIVISSVYFINNYQVKNISLYQTLTNPDDTPKIIDDVGAHFNGEQYHQTVVLTPHLANYDSRGVYLGVQFKMVPTDFINLGAIPRYNNEMYDKETISKINAITDCGLEKSDFSAEIAKIRELGIDYVLFQPCVPQERIEQLPGEIEQIFYSEQGNPFILKKVEEQ
ncbi:MAG: DUF6077 domain-containing protein [Culicoidibacterales bacterium]